MNERLHSRLVDQLTRNRRLEQENARLRDAFRRVTDLVDSGRDWALKEMLREIGDLLEKKP